jgi:retron-type reverse transcriptase
LLHHITIDLLRQSYSALKHDAAPGIDGETWQSYGEKLEEKLKDLHERVHRGSYRSHPAKRSYIPKADGSRRPLSIWCLEDKIVQQAVVTVLGRSTRKTSWDSLTGSGRGEASTMRWTLCTPASTGDR